MSSSERATVLVVDDEPDVADAYTAQVGLRYDARTAYSGEEALEGLDEDVDVVLLDRRMPGVSGEDVLDQIRESDVDCQVAMVTAVNPDFDIIEMPFDDYVSKPVSGEDLYEVIDRLLTSAEYEAKLQEYYKLTTKYATLQANKDDDELEDSEEFQQLTRQREQVQRELRETVDEFDDDDFAAAFRELHEEPATFDPAER
jgi:DNA-binding response OmpR family regulator